MRRRLRRAAPSAARRAASPPGSARARLPGALSLAGWLLPLVIAMALVVSRQTRADELERELRGVRERQAIVEAERVETVRRIQALSSRARVVRAARERLGMHLPADDEIVFLAVPAAERDSATAPAGAEPVLAVER